LAHAPGLDAHRLPADDLLDFDAFADPPPMAEPYAGLWRLTMDRALMDFAAGCGASSVLTGCGADELLDRNPYHLADLIRRGRLLSAWREAAAWGIDRNCNAWEVLGPFGLVWLRASLPTWLGGYGRAAGATLREHGEGALPSWVRPEFSRR